MEFEPKDWNPKAQEAWAGRLHCWFRVQFLSIHPQCYSVDSRVLDSWTGLTKVLWEPDTGVFLSDALKPTTPKFHEDTVYIFINVSCTFTSRLHSQGPALYLVQCKSKLIYFE